MTSWGKKKAERACPQLLKIKRHNIGPFSQVRVTGRLRAAKSGWRSLWLRLTPG